MTVNDMDEFVAVKEKEDASTFKIEKYEDDKNYVHWTKKDCFIITYYGKKLSVPETGERVNGPLGFQGTPLSLYLENNNCECTVDKFMNCEDHHHNIKERAGTFEPHLSLYDKESTMISSLKLIMSDRGLYVNFKLIKATQ